MAETQLVAVRDGVEIRTVTKYDDADMAKWMREVDLAAGDLRELLVPPGAGIELTYTEKQREALEFFATRPSPEDYGDYPFLASEAAVDGGTVADAAATVLYRAEIFRTVGPVIEYLRRSARKALATEREAAKVDAILAGVSRAGLVAALKAKGMTDAQLAALMSGAR